MVSRVARAIAEAMPLLIIGLGAFTYFAVNFIDFERNRYSLKHLFPMQWAFRHTRTFTRLWEAL
jgi:hypothetical protein